jgi:hypothetical protein
VSVWRSAKAYSAAKYQFLARLGLLRNRIAAEVDHKVRFASPSLAPGRHSSAYPIAAVPFQYTAGILIIVASGPALGSWLAAALVVTFSLPFLLYRTITEDQILQVELAGYSDYATRVQWRLFPGI